MKKVYKKAKYKLWNNKKSYKASKKKKKTSTYTAPKNIPAYRNYKPDFVYIDPIPAPKSLCLLEETEKCLDFFEKIRKENNVSKYKKNYYVQISLADVTDFDYSTICILTAIINDLKSKNISVRGDFPKDKKCKKKLRESGLLNSFYDQLGNPYKKAEKSDFIFIEKGSKKLTREQNIMICEKVKNVMLHLTGEKKHFKPLNIILKEICGNSLEWGGTKRRQWLLGIKYEDDKVIFTITDVGKGILKTLHKKFNQKIIDFFTKNNEEILKGAFIKKYGSKSEKVNRNKGLPVIKAGFDNGILKDLKVLTNDVILHYDDDNLSKVINGTSFDGTLYRWVVTKDSLLKAS